MTSKEAKGNLMYALKWNDMPEKEALKIAIKALDNEDVLDKIREAVESIDTRYYSSVYGMDMTECADDFKHEILLIIDKYREGENE